MQPEMLCDYACNTGENPYWHPLEKRVYWTDIPSGRLFWFDPATGAHQQCYQGRQVGGFTVQPDGALLLFLDKGTVALWRDGKIQRTLIEEIPDERATRFNDVIADPAGRVFCGTMPTKERLGRLYRLDTDGSLHLILEGIKCSNGMGFSPDRRHLYYTDSGLRQISVFDYDAGTGALSNRRPLITTPADEGVPDGMTVDSRGDIWSTRWDGWCAVRYSPGGQELGRIRFPVKKVSSVVFGGPDCQDMYFTTAGGQKKEENGPQAGALFRVRASVPGTVEFYSRIGV